MGNGTCSVCLGPMPSIGGNGRRRLFCSEQCRSWSSRHFNRKTCTVDGCVRPNRARGLCSSHYNQQNQPDRHQKREVPCSWCGTLVLKHSSGKRRPICSDECRRKLTFGDKPPRPKRSKALVGPIRVEKSTEPPVTIVKGTRLKWIAGSCEWCGDFFVKVTTGLLPSACSDRCVAKLSKARADVRKGRFQIAPARRRLLYERDNWTCQLCMEPIDREAHFLDDWAPSLDHVIPQSHMLIPDHSDENLRTAHRWCNAVRGDDSYYTAADFVA